MRQLHPVALIGVADQISETDSPFLRIRTKRKAILLSN